MSRMSNRFKPYRKKRPYRYAGERSPQKKDPFVPPEYQALLDAEDTLRRSKMPYYTTFDDYVKAHPEGEEFRRWLTNDGRYPNVLFIPAGQYMLSIPGDYVWSRISHWDGEWSVFLHDCDDGLMKRIVKDEQEAHQVQQELINLFPFEWSDLKEFGWNYD